MAKLLAEGDKAPTFTLETDGGKKVSLKDFVGKPTVLYFYPKDDTPGCTTEALGFSAAASAFKKAGAAVIGVSKDTVASHDKFKKKHDLSLIPP
jgi:peroxiredoxin Q/BCP